MFHVHHCYVEHHVTYRHALTHCGQDKMDAISQTTFSSAISWMKMYEFRLKFHWSLFLRVQLTIFQHWFRWWLGAIQATSHYLKQWWLIYRRIYASLGLNGLTTFDIIHTNTSKRVILHALHKSIQLMINWSGIRGAGLYLIGNLWISALSIVCAMCRLCAPHISPNSVYSSQSGWRVCVAKNSPHFPSDGYMCKRHYS